MVAIDVVENPSVLGEPGPIGGKQLCSFSYQFGGVAE